METKKVVVNEKEYLFVNESGSTRNGFYHRSVLLRNGNEIMTNKVNYLNRTWECYRYQTAMRGCVSQLKANRAEKLKNEYKTVNMISRMTAKRQAEFETILNNDSLYKEYEEIEKALR